ncbi:MAG: SprT family zinc-dependent metalloprotease [Bdellovibrionia bacterium]
MHRVSASSPDFLSPDFLTGLFSETNRTHFDGFLDEPILAWNPRLRTCAGRFIPGSRKFPESFPAKIEVASYLLEELDAIGLIRDTLAHEMIHYWLWVRRRPYGHTSEFLLKMKAMGVSRYNSVPRLGRLKYSYECVNCKKSFAARKKLGVLACSDCCKRFSKGNYDPRFKLILVNPVEVNYD